jgi:hypothetical protein
MSTNPIRKDSASGRFYDIDGDLYPSVTHVLQAIAKPALIAWAANTERALVSEAAAKLYEHTLTLTTPMQRDAFAFNLGTMLGKEKAHQRELAKAGDIGAQAHKLVEWTMRTALGAQAGPKPVVSDKALWAFMAFEDWAKSVSLKPLLIERTVYSKTHRYAGTMDLLARVHGAITLVDFKTGKGIYPEAFLQSAAYSAALEEMGYAAPTAALIVRLPKVETDPEFETKEVPAATTLLPVFLATKVLWEWTYQNEAAYRARQTKAVA